MIRVARKRMGVHYPDTVYYMDVRSIWQIYLNVQKHTQEQESCRYVELLPPHAAAKLIQIPRFQCFLAKNAGHQRRLQPLSHAKQCIFHKKRTKISAILYICPVKN